MDRRFLRPGWIAGHVLVFLAFLTCLRLGWWQWGRTQDTDGTAQNFGYALLWPAFGAAFIYMWVRFLHLEVLKDEQDDEQTDRDLRELLGDGGPDGEEPADRPSVAGPVVDPVAGHPESSTDHAGPEPAVAGSDNSAESTDEAAPPARRGWRGDLQRPSQGVTLSVAIVGEDDEDDPELTAYNRALAALAEEDRRRAR